MLDDYVKKDLRNKDYYGLYEIVANEITKTNKLQNELFVSKIQAQVLSIFYDDYCKKNDIKKYIKMNGKDMPIIFPKDKSVILSPIVFDYGNDNQQLTYFVFIPTKVGDYTIYHWNYFETIKPKYLTGYGMEVNKQLNQITKWNFSFDTLDDVDFWNNYVLVKSGNSFKYLQPIN